MVDDPAAALSRHATAHGVASSYLLSCAWKPSKANPIIFSWRNPACQSSAQHFFQNCDSATLRWILFRRRSIRILPSDEGRGPRQPSSRGLLAERSAADALSALGPARPVWPAVRRGHRPLQLRPVGGRMLLPDGCARPCLVTCVKCRGTIDAATTVPDETSRLGPLPGGRRAGMEVRGLAGDHRGGHALPRPGPLVRRLVAARQR